MNPSAELIESFRQSVIEASNDPSFVHHPWFVKYHLEIVDRIANELLDFYPEANRELVKVLVWIHDYGKAIDFDNQFELTLTKGRAKLEELGFAAEFTDKVIEYMSILERKLELDLYQAPIEVQIVSSADGCSHFVGPFMSLWWWEHPDKSVEELLSDNHKKIDKDWNRKIVLPEARKAFENHHTDLLQRSGDLPDKFLSTR